MVHDNDYLKRVIDDLSKYVKDIYVNLNDPTEKNRKIVEKHPNVKKIVYTSNANGNWRQSLQRGITVRMLDEVKPDIVVFPDDDEIFPPDLIKILKDFWKSKKKALYFTMDYCWNNENQIRVDSVFGRMHHVRAFKWEPNLTYHPYPGKSCPRNMCGLDEVYSSCSNIKHLGYMTKKNRMNRYKRDKKGHYISDLKGIPIKLIKTLK